MIGHLENCWDVVQELKTAEKEEIEKRYEIPLFIQDIWENVFKCTRSDLVALSCVSGWLNKSSRDYYKNYQPEGCFGLKKWNERGVNFQNIPPVPLKMIQNFDPLYWMLTFIPEEINGENLNYSSIDRFLSDCINGNDAFETNYCRSLNKYSIIKEEVESFKSHWVLLSKNVLGGDDCENGTRNKNFESQKILVEQAGYEMPHLLDVITSLFMHHLRTDEFIYPLKSKTGELSIYTRVQEKNKNGNHIIVGGYSFLGLSVIIQINSSCENRRFGAACSLRSIGH